MCNHFVSLSACLFSFRCFCSMKRRSNPRELKSHRIGVRQLRPREEGETSRNIAAPDALGRGDVGREAGRRIERRNVYISIYLHIYISIYLYLSLSLHIYIYIYIYICIGRGWAPGSGGPPGWSARRSRRWPRCLSVVFVFCLFAVCMYIYIYTYVCMYV